MFLHINVKNYDRTGQHCQFSLNFISVPVLWLIPLIIYIDIDVRARIIQIKLTFPWSTEVKQMTQSWEKDGVIIFDTYNYHHRADLTWEVSPESKLLYLEDNLGPGTKVNFTEIPAICKTFRAVDYFLPEPLYLMRHRVFPHSGVPDRLIKPYAQWCLDVNGNPPPSEYDDEPSSESVSQRDSTQSLGPWAHSTESSTRAGSASIDTSRRRPSTILTDDSRRFSSTIFRVGYNPRVPSIQETDESDTCSTCSAGGMLSHRHINRRMRRLNPLPTPVVTPTNDSRLSIMIPEEEQMTEESFIPSPPTTPSYESSDGSHYTRWQ